MKIFHILAVLATFIPCAVFAEVSASMVPGIGSVWRSTLEYKNLHTEGAAIRRNQETYTVSRLNAGVPVFDGEVFGYKGSVQETRSGTVVYTDKCLKSVPQELLASPPTDPNQCVWGICNPSEKGVTFQRKMMVFAELYMCEPKVGTYTFTALRREVLPPFGEVVVGDAKVYFGPFAQTSWLSYILPGHGEVYATSSARETVYQEVKVVHSVFTPPSRATATLETPALVQEGEEPKECRLVAFGDSLTEGMGATRADAYPAKLGEELGIHVCNMGISGNTSEVAKKRVGEVVNLSPKVVVVGVGANDLLQGIPLAQTEQNLRQIVSSLLEAGVMVVVLGFDGIAKPEAAGVISAAMDSFKGSEGLLYLSRAFVGVLDVPEHISSDGMHPNAKGYEALAKNIMDQAFGILRVIPSVPQ